MEQKGYFVLGVEPSAKVLVRNEQELFVLTSKGESESLSYSKRQIIEQNKNFVQFSGGF